MVSSQHLARWDIWHALFEFLEGKGYEYRPVIVAGTSASGNIVMMVMSASNKLNLPHDYIIKDWQEAGLDKPSIAWADRIIEIPPDYLGTAGYIGRLSDGVITELQTIFAEITSTS